MIRRIAAERLSLPIEQLAARDGAIVARDGRFIGYGELIIGDALHVRASPTSALKAVQTPQWLATGHVAPMPLAKLFRLHER